MKKPNIIEKNEWWSRNFGRVENKLSSLVQRDDHEASQQGHVEMNSSIVTRSKLVNEMVGQVAKQVGDAEVERLCVRII